MQPMVIHGCNPNESTHPRTTLYYRAVCGRGKGQVKDMAQMNTDPLCEFPLLAALPAVQAALRQGGVPQQR